MRMKRLIVTLAAAAMTCSAIFAQNRGDMYVGGILGVSGGSSKTSVTVGSTTVKGDSTPSGTEFNLTGEFGYFFADNWRVSCGLGYELLSSPTGKKDGKWLKDNTNVFAIGPSIAYYLNVTGNLYYTPEFGICGYNYSTTSAVQFSLGIKPSVGFRYYF